MGIRITPSSSVVAVSGDLGFPIGTYATCTSRPVTASPSSSKKRIIASISGGSARRFTSYVTWVCKRDNRLVPILRTFPQQKSYPQLRIQLGEGNFFPQCSTAYHHPDGPR